MIDTEKIEKRVIRNFYDDGLSEISLGLFLLFLSACFLAQNAVPKGSVWKSILGIAVPLLIVASALLVNRILRSLKRRIAYPRTGYVEFKKKNVSKKRKTAVMASAAVISASLTALMSIAPSSRTVMPALNGLLLAVAFLFFAVKVGAVRFFIQSAASALIGLAVTVSGVDMEQGVCLFFGLIGAMLAVAGTTALISYLRRSPRPESGADDGE